MTHYSNTRPAAVSGMFYPETSAEIKRQLESFFMEISSSKHPTPKALIVPHAGYIYSGIVAATAYDSLQSAAAQIKTVILFGPSHRVPLQGLALPTVEKFQTPLGDIDLDKAAIHTLVDKFQQVQFSDIAHEEEHSIEVQLPFLQTVLKNFILIPFVVGDADTRDVSEVIEALWGGQETLIVISSDLSHFHPYDQARHLDRQTAGLIESFKGEDLPEHSACGRIPIRGLLHLALKRGMSIKRFDLRNSGDTAGSHEQVVGYGAWGLYES